MRLARVVAAAVAAVALATAAVWHVAPARADDPSLEQTQLQSVIAAPLPRRDMVDLAERYKGLDASALTGLAGPAGGAAHDSFWVADQANNRMFQMGATLRLTTDHTEWYVQDDYLARVDQADLQRSATLFEQQTYPTVQQYFGAAPRPVLGGDPHIVFLLGHVPGAAAYFSGADTVPAVADPHSNQRNLLYFNLDSIQPGNGAFDGTAAHEFQHMLHYARCPYQETWVDEGSAELATRVDGFPGGGVTDFLFHPDTQLTAWSALSNNVLRHYEAAYLFVRYTADRFGGWSALPTLYGACARGPEQFDALLADHGLSFDDLFADWTVANLVNDPSVADGRYAYATNTQIHVASTTALGAGQQLGGQAVDQYAASYVELPASGGTASFSGSVDVPLFGGGADPAGGVTWWSDRADSLDSTLTRGLDLSGVTGDAVATFQAWWDTEQNYDFAYLAASTDGGRTWTTLPGLATVADIDLANGYGVGWTGVSGDGSTGGPQWVDEQVDLSRYAGQRILLRFEYVTDQGYNAQGFAFRNFRIDALGLDDSQDGGAGWTSNGWVPVQGPISQPWRLALVSWPPGQPASVSPAPVGVDGQATISFPAAQRNVLVIAPVAPRTLVPAHYDLAD